MNIRLPLVVCACCAALALSACGGSGGGGASRAALDRVAEERAAAERAAEEARAELERARAALADAQGALQEGEDRTRLAAVLTEAGGELEKAAAALAPSDDEPDAWGATRAALTATRTALDKITEAVREAEGAGAAAPVAADAHRALDGALEAVAAALTAVAEAQESLDAAPDAEAAAALAQARSALLTAQLSLAPLLRSELDAAEADVARLTVDVSAAETAIRAARARVTELEGQLAAARTRTTALERQLAAAGDRTTELEGQLAAARTRTTELEGQLTAERSKAAALETQRAELQALLDAATLTLGENVEMPAGNPFGSKLVRTLRMPDRELAFHEGFDPRPGAASASRRLYTATGGTYDPVQPDPIGYSEGAASIIGAGDLATERFPGRGTILRGALRATMANADAAYAAATDGVDAGDLVRASLVGGYAAGERLQIQGRRTGDADAPSVEGAAADGLIRAEEDKDSVWRNWDAVARTSFRYYDDKRGFTMFYGGTNDGAAIFGDTGTLSSKVGTADDLNHNNRHSYDIEISFGDPSPDPYGERGYWWTMDVPSADADLVRDEEGNPIATTEAEGNYKWMTADGTTQQEDGDGNPLYVSLSPDPVPGPGGAYEAYLSNHAGAAAGADEVPGTEDDAQRWLQYAAYGLFRFTDYATTQVRPGRIQTFHYGFDAFDSDAETPTPPVPAAGADSIAATFAGRTAGWILLPNHADATAGIPRFNHCGAAGNDRCRDNVVDRMVRLRGDVALTACIGGGGTCAFGDGDGDDVAANGVKGTIGGFEYSPGAGRGWVVRNSNAMPEAGNSIHGTFYVDAEIDPATGLWKGAVSPNEEPEPQPVESDGRGPFDATASPTDDSGPQSGRHPVGMAAMSDRWGPGENEGAFYGPADALETAGTWWVPARHDNNIHAGIVGSFGAACTDCAE